jgi:hypothetical protein
MRPLMPIATKGYSDTLKRICGVLTSLTGNPVPDSAVPFGLTTSNNASLPLFQESKYFYRPSA